MSLSSYRTIAVVTGTRAEYGLLSPVMRAIQSSKSLRLQLIVTGMHLSPFHGHTIDAIRADGFPISAVVEMLLGSDSPAAMGKSVGIGIIELTQTLEQLQPDIVLILGDRGEAFAAATAAVHLNLPIAHLHGGESSYGCLDDSLRHAITMLSHIHLTATRRAAERILSMGQEAWRVRVVGAPGLDVILNMKLPTREELSKKYNLDLTDRLILVVQHPETVSRHDHRSEMHATLEALEAIGHFSVLIYPNADAGNSAMRGAIQEFEDRSFLRTFESLPHSDYLGLLKIADVLVGNSSSGIIEAPSFHVPVVNIGTRQAGRERAGNTLDVGYDRAEIEIAIRRSLEDENFRAQVRKCENPYGDGHASARIVAALEEIEINERLLRKQWHES